MQENKITKEKNNTKKKKDFNIIVTYAENENGRSFQSIVEKILIRKIEEY